MTIFNVIFMKNFKDLSNFCSPKKERKNCLWAKHNLDNLICKQALISNKYIFILASTEKEVFDCFNIRDNYHLVYTKDFCNKLLMNCMYINEYEFD